MKEFNENERKEFDIRYNLLINIQYSISLLQSALVNIYVSNNDQKTIEDFQKLSKLQAQLPEYSIQTLRKIYHDITLKLGELINER